MTMTMTLRNHSRAPNLRVFRTAIPTLSNRMKAVHPISLWRMKLLLPFSYRRNSAWKLIKIFHINSRKYSNFLFMWLFNLLGSEQTSWKLACEVGHACHSRSFNPNFLADEQYFSVPLQIIRRKLSGVKDSLVSSSVWRPEFKRSLEKYPDFELVALDFAVPSCDACHLGGRMSTLLGRLSGSAYNRSGFEAVSHAIHNVTVIR